MRPQIGKYLKTSYQLAACLAILSVAMVGQAQTQPATAPAQPVLRTVSLTISAQPLEKPDLAFALLPKIEDTQKGNAAVKYLIASAETVRPPMDDSDIITKLMATPLQDIDEPTTKKVLNDYMTSYLFRVMPQKGAHLDLADWETNSRAKGIYTLIPGLGRFKQLANLLCIAIRLDIKNHRWTDALDKLQTGYAMARHMGEGETLIESLVGIAIAQLMDKCVEDWIAQPDAPNLYWPLANLPHPFNDLRKAMEFERANLIFTFPELREMRDGHYSAEQCISLAKHLSIDVQRLDSSSLLDFNALPPWGHTMVGVDFAAVEYPLAKRFLLQRGLKNEELEKMPVPEVLGRYFIRSIDETYDNMFKWCSLPPSQSLAGLAKAEQEFVRARPDQIDIVSGVFLPSMRRAVFLAAAVDRHIDMLRIVEAMRVYAAQNGSLPDSLQQLSLPVPLDLVIGTPFSYEHHADTATLIAQNPEQNSPYSNDGFRYTITLTHP